MKTSIYNTFRSPFNLLVLIITILQLFDVSCKRKDTLEEFRKTKVYKFNGTWKVKFFYQVEQKPSCRPYKFFKYYTGKKVQGLVSQTFFGGKMAALLLRSRKRSRWGQEFTLTLEMDVIEKRTRMEGKAWMVGNTYTVMLLNTYFKDIKDELILYKGKKKYRFAYKFNGRKKLRLSSINTPCPSNTVVYLEKEE